MIHLLLAVIYMAFISLGLPDGLLGAAWPLIYPEFSVPVSYAGIVYGIIAFGTIVSSLASDWVTRRLGAGRVTAISVAMTALALVGFSCCDSYWQMLLWAIPYGLGAGSVDAGLNTYVALHYESQHMSWLHCMWGLGATVGPYIMSACLTGGQPWNMGYRTVGILQLILTALLVLSLPLWKQKSGQAAGTSQAGQKSLTIPQTLAVPGAKAIFLMFFCYCALEQTAMLWGSSYLVIYRGLPEELAARYAGLVFIGITLGRFVNGFLALRLRDRQMIRMGQAIIALGIVTMVLPLGSIASLAGLFLIGLGCAPIYPCVIHSTPFYFGADKAQSIVGMQMASAYIGTLTMPPLFGLIANHLTPALMPAYLLVLLALMFAMHEKLSRVKPKEAA